MPKIIAYDQKAFEAIRRGVGTLTRTVCLTLGPRGHTVLLQKKFGAPVVTKDGVTVAREIELDDPFENMGAQMVCEVAAKTNDVAGDGTTTATLLADAILKEGLRAVAAGINPVLLKQGIERAVADVVQKLQEMSVPVKDKSEIAQVASIAANDDHAIGNEVAEAIEMVGQDGVVTLDEGKTMKTEMELVEGMQFDKGYLSPYFVTDPIKMECVLGEPYILVHEKKIVSVKDVVTLLQLVAQSGAPLLFIADDVEGDALATLVVNHLRGTVQCCAVKAPGFGDRRKALLEDLAILVGAAPVMEGLGKKLESISLTDLGRAKKVIVGKDQTTLIEGAGSEEAIQTRIASIRRELDQASGSYDREQLEKRLAKLTGGVAKISVGAITESELKEKKFLYEDAINAAKAVRAEGIVPGGGVALLRAASACTVPGTSQDEDVGYRIVLRACRAPIACIADNAGQDGRLVCARVAERTGAFGYNALTDQYEDLVQAGVIDPTKVVRVELQNAASVATLLLTSDALIAEKPAEEEAATPGYAEDYEMY